MALKVGVEDKKKVAIAAGLGVVVLLLAAYTIFGGPDTPPPAPRPAVAVAPVPASANPAPATSTRDTAASANLPAATTSHLDPSLHPELMAENEAFAYHGSGRNIFSLYTAPPPSAVTIEAPKGPVRPTIEVAQAPAGPPPPPSIDLRFFGYSARKDGSRKAFLLHGEDVFIASEGDVVSHRYKVVRIAPTSIQVEDLPYHNTQSLPLVQN